MRPLLLFVQAKAVPPIFNFLKGQGQGSDFFFAKTNHPEPGQVFNDHVFCVNYYQTCFLTKSMKDFNKAAGFQVPQIDTGFFTNTNLSWLSILKNTIEERFSHNNIDKEGAF